MAESRKRRSTAPKKATEVRPRSARSKPPSPPPPTRAPTEADDAVAARRVVIRTDKGFEQPIETLPEMKQLAMQWSYILRNRRRWNSDPSLRADLERRVLEQVELAGFSRASLKPLVEAEIIEVCVPFFDDESKGWQLRIFPWEYVLSTLVRTMRPDHRVTVVRHLDRRGPVPATRAATTTPPTTEPRKLLIVVSAPSHLARTYSFASERKVVRHCFGSADVRELSDPTRQRLAQAVAEYAPDVVHLSGFDNHQALALLRELRRADAKSQRAADAPGLPDERDMRDGMVLAAEDRPGEVDFVHCEDLAQIVNGAAAAKPALVVCNFWNTAARLCPLLVGRGAGAAVGFQDAVDDTDAENFLATFYRTWRRSQFNTPWSFHTAWQISREDVASNRQGSGVVLWQADPLRSATAGGEQAQAVARQSRSAVYHPGGGADAPPLSDALEITVRPKPSLNYALLHNNRGMFNRFDVRKLVEGTIRGVTAEVVLHVGNDNFPCLVVRDLDKDVTDFDACMRPALTSEILCRASRESVRTAVTVKLSCGADVLYCDTHRTTLLPIDEWLDNDEERDWLPSFVLPRDPAVVRVIQAAQQHLMAILDDPGAGFDGYQRVDPGDPDSPGLVVDPQVQAIWTAILHDLPVHYINPPPTFSDSSQRLRRPSDVVTDRCGTCIDTALLLAACLEYVDIYPVLFLLKGHAFPGYWRSADAHVAFVEARGRFQRERRSAGNRDVEVEIAAAEAREPSGPAPARKHSRRWAMGRENFVEILRCIEAQQLVPLESVLLTTHGSFAQGANEGMQNLRDPDEFDSLVDIKLARKHDVLPLPVAGVAVGGSSSSREVRP